MTLFGNYRGSEWKGVFFFRCLIFWSSECERESVCWTFPGVKPVFFVGKKISQKGKSNCFCGKCEWPANCPWEKIHLVCLYRVARKKQQHLLKLSAWAVCKFYPGKNTIRFGGRGGEECRPTFNHLPLH